MSGLSRAAVIRFLPLLGTAVVCAYLLAFRVHGIEDHYPMLGEQVRDWSIAQRGFTDLPSMGPRSVNSGLDIGPVYYWVLWAGRVLVQPVLGPLPHTGGWVIALLATLGDGVLLLALWRRFQSWWLAAAIVVVAATAAPDAYMSSVVWNPPVAEAFAKLATASVLWPAPASIPRAVLTMALALSAVQCHFTGLLIAVPLVAWTLWALGRERGRRAVATALLAGAVGVGAWATPYLSRAPAPHTADGPSGAVVQSLVNIARDPVARLRPIESANAVAEALRVVFLTPYAGNWFRVLLLACLVLMIVFVRDPAVLAASVGPMLTAVAVFSLWQGPFGEVYWFFVIVPAAAICMAAPALALPRRVRWTAIVGLVAITVALQPARAHYLWTEVGLPAYGPLAVGTSAAAAAGIPVRGIKASFAVPEGMDVLFMFSLVGGRLDANAPVVLLIHQDGRIEYVEAGGSAGERQ